MQGDVAAPHATNLDLLRVAGLSIAFKTRGGALQATRDVCLTIARGERIGLVGESGCGKTVTGLSLMRLLPESLAQVTGEISLEGRSVPALSDRALRAMRGREIAMIFQEPMTALDPVFTVGAQIGEAYRTHFPVSTKLARERAIAMLADVGIPEPARRYHEYPHQLSGGMRQRVMIAMALVCEPKLIIADEPTTALDVTVQAQIIDLLQNLSARKGTALVFITHDLGVVAEICTRVVTMYAGEVIEDGRIDDILMRPRHPYTSGLLSSLPSLAARRSRLLSIAGRVPSSADMPAGCRFRSRCPHAIAGCEREQPMLDVSPGHTARCWRAPDLVLPGAVRE